MTELKQVYKCNICGNIVELLHAGEGELVCCGQPMSLQKEKTEDPQLGEKHVPIIEIRDTTVFVNVGSVEHPMEEAHYIEWIELLFPDRIYRKYLTAQESPSADFPYKGDIFEVRIYCNMHGIWKSN